MKVKIKISRTNETKKITIKDNLKIKDLLKEINLKPDTLIVMSKDKPVPIDDDLTDGQELTIMQVSSGG